jgi:hypothetical protein
MNQSALLWGPPDTACVGDNCDASAAHNRVRRVQLVALKHEDTDYGPRQQSTVHNSGVHNWLHRSADWIWSLVIADCGACTLLDASGLENHGIMDSLPTFVFLFFRGTHGGAGNEQSSDG